MRLMKQIMKIKLTTIIIRKLETIYFIDPVKNVILIQFFYVGGGAIVSAVYEKNDSLDNDIIISNNI